MNYKHPLAPLKFQDKRPDAEQTVKLEFVPVNIDLLNAYENLWVENFDLFGRTYSPLYTVSQLLEFWLETKNKKGSPINPELLDNSFRLLNYLIEFHSQSQLIEFYREEAKKSVTYVEKGVSHAH